jgi:hypothetical protein
LRPAAAVGRPSGARRSQPRGKFLPNDGELIFHYARTCVKTLSTAIMLRRGKVLVVAICAFAATAADSALEPLTVCEVFKDLPAEEGKAVAVLGRFSFRRDGRTINEEACGPKPAQGETAAPNTIRLIDDAKSGPKPPEIFALDGAAVSRKLKTVEEHTTLRTFRFGTPDYDRWAVVYGRVEADKKKDGVRLIYRGDGVILFLHDN